MVKKSSKDPILVHGFYYIFADVYKNQRAEEDHILEASKGEIVVKQQSAKQDTKVNYFHHCLYFVEKSYCFIIIACLIIQFFPML